MKSTIFILIMCSIHLFAKSQKVEIKNTFYYGGEVCPIVSDGSAVIETPITGYWYFNGNGHFVFLSFKENTAIISKAFTGLWKQKNNNQINITIDSNFLPNHNIIFYESYNTKNQDSFQIDVELIYKNIDSGTVKYQNSGVLYFNNKNMLFEKNNLKLSNNIKYQPQKIQSINFYNLYNNELVGNKIDIDFDFIKNNNYHKIKIICNNDNIIQYPTNYINFKQLLLIDNLNKKQHINNCYSISKSNISKDSILQKLNDAILIQPIYTSFIKNLITFISN
ncbi:hypothetical protein ACFOWM_13410 [Ferruginibacter yonginensis]|uniref:Uncharacterized protein n=1 Tax=Ferruginibacter yonginensis TaxID=1310416 RepID=A0ABV8QUC0_9BACT